MNNLVSIIVPVYNTEKYLEQCLESIINQSYEKIEIILINDGSTDLSKKICEKFSEKDQRIIFIDKKNEGVSVARNLGVERAKGEYITFIDSDDFVEKNFIEYMICEIIKNKGDFISAGMKIYSYRGIEKFITVKEPELIENQQKVIEAYLIEKKIPAAVGGKFYKTEVLKKIKYPIGKINEDLATMVEILLQCNKVIISPNSGYYYRKMGESITRGKYTIKRLELLEAHDRQINNLKKFNDKILDEARLEKMDAIIYLIDDIISARVIKENTEEIIKLQKELQEEIKQIVKKEKISENFYLLDSNLSKYLKKRKKIYYSKILPSKIAKKFILLFLENK